MIDNENENEYTQYLKNNFKFDNEYLLENDFENVKKEKYHLGVLPQPFWGEVSNEPEIVFLALNPSYVPTEDEIDTHLYKYFRNDYNNYFEDLCKTDFTKEIDDQSLNLILKEGKLEYPKEINYCFINAWKWWKTRVFKDIFNNVKEESKKRIAILNLCQYHSESYFQPMNGETFIWLESQKKAKALFKNIIDKATVVVIVWGANYWKEYLGIDLFTKENCIILNKTTKKDNDENYKYAANINSLQNVLKDKEFLNYPQYKENTTAICLLNNWIEANKNEE